MDQPLDPRKVVNWDSYNWAKALAFWDAHLPPGLGLRVLEIGSGSGGVSLWFAFKGHRVLCSDVLEPGAPVRDLHATNGFATGIEYAAIDATNIPFEGVFDVIVTKSVLGGVGFGHRTERVQQAIAQIRKALKPGGLYLFAENLEGTSLHRFLRKRLRKWGGEWHYFQYEELLGYLGAFPMVEHRSAGFLGLFGWSESLRRGLGALDSAVFDRVVPPMQRYIMIGAARKLG